MLVATEPSLLPFPTVLYSSLESSGAYDRSKIVQMTAHAGKDVEYGGHFSISGESANVQPV